MTGRDLERIAKHALRDLGAGDVSISVTAAPQPDRWRIEVGGAVQTTLSIRASASSTPQFVREQIMEQFSKR